MPVKNGKVLNLDDLVKSPGQVIVFGKTLDVSPIDGRALQLVRSMGEESGNEAIKRMYEVAQLLLPALSSDDVEKLTPEQIEALITVATDRVRQVEDAIQDPKKPAAEPSAAPPAEQRSA